MVFIKANDLSVEFPVGNIQLSLRSTLRSKVGGVLKRGNTNQSDSNGVFVKALSKLNFDFGPGDRIGLIGHNGAGKSTLLQTLNGGYFPTSGKLETRGKIVPLLNLGNGAVPDFSGRENIALLGLHMGMSRAEISRNTEDIISFAELGEYIDLPIRTYSSGMYLRLSYAIATSATPEILLIDELFGAGDQGFYKKAEQRMESLMERSGILVFATHAMALIQQYCNKAMVLNHGEISYFGDCNDAVEYYSETNN